MAFFLSISVAVHAQEPLQEAIAALAATYDEVESYKLEVSYELRGGLVDEAATPSFSGTYVKVGDLTYYRLQEMEYLQNSSYTLTAYHDDQIIMYTETADTLDINLQQQVSIEQFLKMLEQLDWQADTTVNGDIALTIRLPVEQGRAQSFRLVFDPARALAKEFQMTVDDAVSGMRARMLLKYNQQAFDIPLDRKVYDRSKFITLTGGKAELKAPYQHYELYQGHLRP